MTIDDIIFLDEARAFSATVNFEVLERLHVPFDQLTRTQETESRLSPLVRQGRRVAVRAASGEGKSSVIAAVVGPLMLDKDAPVIPLRIPVAGAPGEVVTDTTTFLEYALKTMLRWSERDVLDRKATRTMNQAERKLREHQETRRASLTIPLWVVQPDLAREVTTTIKAIENYSDALGEMKGVVSLLKSANKSPVFIFDDTDTWLQSIELDRQELAVGFFAGPFRALVKDVDVGIVIAVHPSYEDIREYQMARELLDATIDVPRFDDRAHEALTLILDRRIKEKLGSKVEIVDIIQNEAIAVLARVYQTKAGHHNLRAMLRIANTALEHARRNRAPIITHEMVEQAVVEELG